MEPVAAVRDEMRLKPKELEAFHLKYCNIKV